LSVARAAASVVPEELEELSESVVLVEVEAALVVEVVADVVDAVLDVAAVSVVDEE
jgi:hypothetical protein